MRLALGLFFLSAGAGLLALRFAAPDLAARFQSPTQLLLAGVFGVVLGGLNLARWYAAVLDFHRRATPVRRPFERDPGAARDEEPNPDFDFGKGEGPK
jgi:hypothetical protein